MIKATTLAVLLSSVAVMGHAGNPEPAAVEPAVVAAPVASFWDGGYVGAQLGYVYGEFDLGSNPGDFNNDSVIGGLSAGYLWSLNNGWYVGPEFQYDFADVSVKDSDTGDTASFDEIGRLKLIVGREVLAGQGLVYGSAGIAYAAFDDVGDVFDGFDGSDTNYVVGFGYDHRVAEAWTIGGEYMYHGFNGVGASGGDVKVNTLHLKATYRY